MHLKLHPKAEDELIQALAYYGNINSNLKNDFIFSLESVFEKIVSFPGLYQYETKVSQKVVMQKFPYVILYEKYLDVIMILAIFHTSRNPNILQDRM